MQPSCALIGKVLIFILTLLPTKCTGMDHVELVARATRWRYRDLIEAAPRPSRLIFILPMDVRRTLVIRCPGLCTHLRAAFSRISSILHLWPSPVWC